MEEYVEFSNKVNKIFDELDTPLAFVIFMFILIVPAIILPNILTVTFLFLITIDRVFYFKRTGKL